MGDCPISWFAGLRSQAPPVLGDDDLRRAAQALDYQPVPLAPAQPLGLLLHGRALRHRRRSVGRRLDHLLQRRRPLTSSSSVVWDWSGCIGRHPIEAVVAGPADAHAASDGLTLPTRHLLANVHTHRAAVPRSCAVQAPVLAAHRTVAAIAILFP
jgi:hypothetical protein